MSKDTIYSRGLEDIQVAETRLSRIDGDAGDLVIGGFPVDELAADASYEETVYLLINGGLPTASELDAFRLELASQRHVGDPVLEVLRAAAEANKPAMDALRMGAATANLDTGNGSVQEDASRLIAVFPTIVASFWRYRRGEQPVAPREDLGHAANYLYMLTGSEPAEFEVRGLETYLNTVIDHGLNASTFAARVVVSTESDLVSAVTAAVGTLKGPLHGGAPGPVLDTLEEVHESDEAEAYIRAKLDAGERLMGFGHRVYRVRDPRATVLSRAAERFYRESGDAEFFDAVQEFEKMATDILADWKPDRRLETNVEFYTAVLLHGIGIPKDLFTATFGVSRVGGWVAHAIEQLEDNRLIRPRAAYVGEEGRSWIPIQDR